MSVRDAVVLAGMFLALFGLIAVPILPWWFSPVLLGACGGAVIVWLVVTELRRIRDVEEGREA